MSIKQARAVVESISPSRATSEAALLGDLSYYIAAWAVWVWAVRWTCAKILLPDERHRSTKAEMQRAKQNAASIVSLSYCATAVAWASLALWRQVSPTPDTAGGWRQPPHALDFTLNVVGDEAALPFGMSVRGFILFSAAYFATDLVFDWDPRFATHHLLSLAAMATTWLAPHLEGSFALTALIAEIGGVVFHISKLARRRSATLLFLVVYTTTRIVFFPVFIAWLLHGIYLAPTLVNVWAVGGTAALIAINIQWCHAQWMRFLRLERVD